MSDNNFDVFITPKEGGWEIRIDYWHFNRDKNNPRMTSRTSYTWHTDCKEIVQTFKERKTKIFYSQLRVLTRMHGKREKEKFNFTRNIKIL